jgi:hypothetical protein
LLFNSHNQFAQNNWGLIEPTTIETFIEKLDDNEKLENNLNAMLCLIDNQNIKEVVNEVKQEITSAKADKLSPGNMQRLVKVLAENIPVIHKLVEIYKENQEGPEISELALQESIKTIENTKCQIEMKKDVSDNSWLLRDDYFIDKEIENLQSTLSPNKLISSRYKSPQHNESQGTISLKGENSIVYIRNHKDIDPEELNLLSAIKEKMKQYVTVVERAIDEASGEGGDDFENVSSIEDETSGEKANFYDDFDDYDDDEVISDEEERQDTVSNDEVSFKSETSGAKKNFDDDIQNSDNDYDDDIQVSDDELFIPDEKKRQEPVSIDEGSFEDKIIGANPKDYHDIEDFDDDKFIPDKEKGGKHVYNYAGHRVDRKRVSSNHNNKQINPYNPTIEHKNFEANTNSTKNEITSFKDKILKKNNLKYLVSGAATGGLSGVATFALMTKKSRNYVDNLIGIKFLNHQMVRILLINAAIFLPIIASIIFIISKELYNSNKLVKNNIEDLDKNNEPGGCSRI